MMKLYLDHEEYEYEVHIEGWESSDPENCFEDLDGYVLDEDNEEMPDEFFKTILEENVLKVQGAIEEAQTELHEQNIAEMGLYYGSY